MPQLGCNYSPQLMSLLGDGRVHVDWIKLSRWEVFQEELLVARPVRPVLLHVLPGAGRPSFADVDWDGLNRAMKDCASPHTALHLEATRADWEDGEPSDDEVVERLVAGTRMWASRMEAPLLVENVPFYDGVRGSLRPATDPDVIGEVCKRADVGLLLDLAHLRVACWHRGEDPHSYLRRLPLERVREIHVCGPEMTEDMGLRDRHLEMGTEDYELLQFALEQTDPLVVSLEYGGTGPKFVWRSEIDALERQVRMLDEMVHFTQH